MLPMKTQDEILRAKALLLLLLSRQVQLDPPMPPEAQANATGVVWALNWVLTHANSKELENLLARIEQARAGPGHNPHQVITE
jgi:hypothetical protein